MIDLVREQQKEINNLKKNIEEINQYNYIKNYIPNLDSLIINNSDIYNTLLKNWIDPVNKVKAEILYRLSRDGPRIKTFHKLCDNKGPSLTLFYLKKGYKIGFFVSDSFDSTSGRKNDLQIFLFSLNKKQKYKKYNNYKMPYSSVNKINSGPSANGLGCNDNINLNYIFYSKYSLNIAYENGGNFIISETEEEENYEVLEIEIFQII